MFALLVASSCISIQRLDDVAPLSVELVEACVSKMACFPPSEKDPKGLGRRLLLVRAGSRAYPAFHKLLESRRTSESVKGDVVEVLLMSNTVPIEFREHAIALTACDSPHVRSRAVELVARIGVRDDARLLVSLCDDVLIRHTVLESLEKLGGPTEAGLLSKWVDSSPKITDADRIRAMKTIEMIRIRSEQK